MAGLLLEVHGQAAAALGPHHALPQRRRAAHVPARAEPLLYYATGAVNPTPYSGVIPGIREEQEQTINASYP